MSIWNIALAMFLVANPIGNTPAFVSLVKNFPFARQKKILFREAIFSYLIALFYLYFGMPFLQSIHVEEYTVRISGGLLLLIVALYMIFPPKTQSNQTEQKEVQEPFFVPIAIPLISGGGVMTTMLYYTNHVKDNIKVTIACTIAWVFVTIIVVSAAYIQKILGNRGLIAMEQLMGMILAMISTEIIVKGITLFIQTSM